MKSQPPMLAIAYFLVHILLMSTVASAASIGASPDQTSGNNWQSAFVDIDPPRDFKKGEHLIIKVQGNAEWVRIRLLPQNGAYDKPTGLIGGKMKIPPSGVIDLVVNEDRLKVKQVSVHAGKLAWNELLNPNGGTVEIVSVEVTAP